MARRAKHEMAVDKLNHQSCRKEISMLKQQKRDQQEQLQTCAESMVALQEQLKREQLERCMNHVLSCNRLHAPA